MSLLQNSNAISTGVTAYNLTDSVRFRQSASAYLSRTNSSSPTNAKIGTLSVWVKRGSLATGNSQYIMETGTGTSNNTHFQLFFDTSNNLNAGQYSQTPFTNTSVYFRDPSAWYHIFIAYDSTQGTAANRFKLYVNNTLYSSTTTISLNNEWAILQASQLINIGRHTTVARHFDGYMTEFNVVDGQALTPSDFGEYDDDTGVWKPKRYTGTYGTNGFYLDMSTSGSTVTDQSGNGNDWTATNMNLTTSTATTYDKMTDVPTLTDEDTANFATLNPLMPNSVSNTTFSDGNLKMTPAANANSYYGLGTIGLKSGKWYFEAQGYRLGTSTSFRIGFSKNQGVVDANIAIYNAAGNYTIEGTTITGKATYTNGDIIGTAVDLDSNTIEFFKNNISQGSVSISSGEWYPHARIYATNSYTTEAIICNFGQQPFKYTPPTGYKKLNTYNLPDSSIVDGSQYMNTVLWTGNGGTQSITGVGFQPDLVWSKKRSSANSHRLFDAVRGAGKLIWSNLTNIESDVGSTEISSFDSDGFTYGGSGANEGSDTVVSWNWRGSDSSAVSNTDGTITSTVSANTTSGFSVVTANSGSAGNKTVGHGLGVAPKLVIMKVRDAVGAWYVWVTGFSASQFLMLNATNAVGTDSRLWANATPTSSVVSFESGYYPATSKELVFYCFADVEGFSKFGSYTGNGSTDGTFVYTGFRPAYVLVKNSTTGGLSWVINDTSRDTYNECNKDLIADGSSAESNPSPGRMDILSNGFKIRSSANSVNQSGNTFIYMAFAENPFKNSLAR